MGLDTSLIKRDDAPDVEAHMRWGTDTGVAVLVPETDDPTVTDGHELTKVPHFEGTLEVDSRAQRSTSSSMTTLRRGVSRRFPRFAFVSGRGRKGRR